jgi:transcriptional regulator with XRE-family HTH domain
MTDVARMVRWARRRAGMTQHDLARAAGMPQPSVARIEMGTVMPRTRTLLSLLRATGHELAARPRLPLGSQELAAIHRALLLDPARRTVRALGRDGRDARTSPTWILRRLRRAGVPFVLIGELAEVVRGVPLRPGRVIEICRDASDHGERQLAAALEDMRATRREDGEFATSVGTLRCVTETAAGDTYEMVRRTATRLLVDTSLLVAVAGIEDLIRNRHASGDRDRDARRAEAMLAAIRETHS